MLLIPGFMAGDASLGDDGQLAAAGRLLHAPHRHPRQLRLLEEACRRLEARLEHMAERHGERVVVIGQSRGGVFARALGARRPELVAGIVTLGSPTQGMLAVHPLVLAQIGLVSALGTARLPGHVPRQLPARQVLRALPAAITGPFPDDVGYVAVYSSRTAS